jgi:single-strand DNA-binding protein
LDASTKEKKTAVTFLDCKIWGKSAENLAQYAKKGSPLHLSGRLEQELWDDKQSGQKRSKIVVVVDEFSFIGGGDKQDSRATAPSAQSQSASVAPSSQPELQPKTEPEDDVPF